MITWFGIGMIVFKVKMIGFAFKASWKLTKMVVFVLGIPVILAGLWIGGMVVTAALFLILALIGAFLLPIRGRGRIWR